MRELDQSPTGLCFLLLTDANVFSPGSEAEERWARLMSENRELGGFWDVDALHAKVLYWALDSFLRFTTHAYGDKKIRVIVDRQDWFSGKRARGDGPRPGFIHIGAASDFDMEAYGIVDKTSDAVRPYLPLLGLVDSELWAFAKTLSLKTHDGTRVHDVYWRLSKRDGPETDDVVIPPDAWEEMFQGQFGTRQQLVQYWKSILPRSESMLETTSIDAGTTMGNDPLEKTGKQEPHNSGMNPMNAPRSQVMLKALGCFLWG